MLLVKLWMVVHGYLSLFLGQGYLGKFKSMMIFADYLVST